MNTVARCRFLLVWFAVACLIACSAPHAAADTWPTIYEQASEQFGRDGAQAAAFLSAHHPPRDADIDPAIVLQAIEVSLAARNTYPWAKQVSDELFLNDVLPYAVLDERRVPSRAKVHAIASPLVKDCTTAEQAAQAINRELFKLVGVSYSTKRRVANQDALETMELGLASCSGLSILMIDACRSVGIPARLAGIAAWPGRGGNHSWVEIHDGQRWRFTGAAEYDARGLDRGWFTGSAAQAIAGHQRHAIWATSWKTTGQHFPLSWNPDDHTVPGVDVTERYAQAGKPDATTATSLTVRLWASRGSTRLASAITLNHAGATHEANTHADPDDINRVAELPAITDRPLTLQVRAGEQTRIATLTTEHQPGRIIELYWDELSLSREAANQLAQQRWHEHAQRVLAERQAELEAMALTLGEHTLKLKRNDFGNAPEGKRSLWISMHGGGGAPTAVNNQQWENQIRLYQPEEGVYIAPRAPTDTWNLWHRPEVDALFDRLIETAIIAWGIDPDRVYLMGYSAGGDGVYQLAPRMADRLAAAAMMAGHPNDATPEGLRNLPFALFMGGDDAAYKRNEVAKEWESKLAALQKDDPAGYTHMVRIYPGLGHWMQRKDAEALPWMAAHTRNPWPRRIVWKQGNTAHQRFYWLAVNAEHAKRGNQVIASVNGQTITLTSADVPSVKLLLSDELLDLDKPIRVIANSQTVYEGIAPRTQRSIDESIALRSDPAMIAAATLTIDLPSE